jgi:predicted MFS family arabinose efflux permease
VPIKAELGLSDAQIGALTGLSFALFYTTLSLPIARLADRANRRNIIAVSLAVWSGMTAFSSLAANYAMLVLFRIGVAVGEAGSIPASQSIIADYYPPERRATAMSTWGLSLPLGLMLGYGVTGWLAQHLGWRYAFAIVGGVGVVIAPLVVLFLKEPARGRFDPPSINPSQDSLSIREALGYLWKMKVMRVILLAAGAHGFTQYSLMNWMVPFYTRIHGMSLSDVALYMAAASGLGGSIGMYAGGSIADKLGARDERWRVWVIGLSIIGMALFALAQLLVPSLWLSLCLGGIVNILMIAYYGPILAVMHSLVPPNARAFTGAVLLLVFNIIGLGLGPFATGFLSDVLAKSLDLGDHSLRWALVCCLVPATLGALAFLRIGNGYRTARQGMQA